MMKNDYYHLLGFSDKYRVDKKLEKGHFLKNAALTPAERKELETQLSSLKILYDLHFPDKSEAIIIEAEVKVLFRARSVANIAKAISSSIPYYTIVFIKYENFLKVVLFNTKRNSKDDHRSVIINHTSSDWMTTNNFHGLDYEIFDAISEVYKECSSVKQFCYRLSIVAQDLKECRQDQREEKRILKQLHEIDCQYSSVIKNAFYESDTHTYNHYRGLNEKRRFVRDCGSYSYGLFWEFAEIVSAEIDKEDIDTVMQRWLEFYVNICCDFAQDVDGISINEEDVVFIVCAFKKHINYQLENYQYEYFDVDDLRYYIEQEEFELGEVFGNEYWWLFNELLDEEDDE